MGKLLVVIGVLFVAAGVAVMAGLPLGRLPGDITWRRGSTTIYFPIVTSLIISVVLTIVLAVIRR